MFVVKATADRKSLKDLVTASGSDVGGSGTKRSGSGETLE